MMLKKVIDNLEQFAQQLLFSIKDGTSFYQQLKAAYQIYQQPVESYVQGMFFAIRVHVVLLSSK